MRLGIYGAAEEVTGSLYLLEHDGRRVLVDCGIFQGQDEDKKNSEPFPFDASTIDAALLTHAHLDHSGRIPLLVKRGFRGKIYATTPTLELCEILWRDSARLMQEEAEWKTRKNKRKGLPPVSPLFTEEEVDKALEFFAPLSYDDIFEIVPEIKVRFRDAGHILGSSIIEVWIGKESVKLVFSGDLGQQITVLDRSPAVINDADYVIIESTYGDRNHKSLDDTRNEFASIIEESLRDRSKILIPTFVVDRVQRLLYELTLLQEKGILSDDIPIYFDSPMGVKTTRVYRKYSSLLSSEVQDRLLKNLDPFSPRGLKEVITPQESKKINDVSFAIVLAGSGMANGGRIVHHLKHNLWNPRSHLIFVGYQAEGTLGRRIIDGARFVKVAGEEVAVKCKAHTIGGFSAHGGQDDLLAWASNFKTNPVFLVTHGERKASNFLARELKKIGFEALVPQKGYEMLLARGRPTVERKIEALAERPFKDLQGIVKDMDILLASLSDALEGVEIVEDMEALLLSAKVLLEVANQRVATKIEVTQSETKDNYPPSTF